MRRGLIVANLTAVAAILISVPAFADALLSGTIKSSDGKAMGGITVSAKPDGGTITTTVFTDAAGQFYFPALPQRQLSGVGAGAELSDRQRRGRSVGNNASRISRSRR